MILNLTQSISHHAPCVFVSRAVGECRPRVQVRMARNVFAAWMQAADSFSLQRDVVEREVSQRANARHMSMAFTGWCRLHQVCKQDAQRVSLCRRCAPPKSDMLACTHSHISGWAAVLILKFILRKSTMTTTKSITVTVLASPTRMTTKTLPVLSMVTKLSMLGSAGKKLPFQCLLCDSTLLQLGSMLWHNICKQSPASLYALL